VQGQGQLFCRDFPAGLSAWILAKSCGESAVRNEKFKLAATTDQASDQRQSLPRRPTSSPRAYTIMAATPDAAKQQSILPTLIPHLDRHLVFPLLQFLEDQEDVDEPSLEHTKLKFELLKHTNMTDFVGDLFAKINNLDEIPEEYAQKREDVLKKREQLQNECSNIQDLLADTEVINNLRSDKVQNLIYLKENHGVTSEMVDALYEFGQFQYSCGDYNSASELLYQFRILVRRASVRIIN
jgi:hypothetical protein